MQKRARELAFEVVTMTATHDLRGVVDFPALLLDAGSLARYDSKMFPCLMLKVDLGSRTISHKISKQGKVVVLGATSLEEIEESLRLAHRLYYAKHVFDPESERGRAIVKEMETARNEAGERVLLRKRERNRAKRAAAAKS